ncbi:uncharacterized protein TNCV_3898871 [Trichonephila clavipes]|nr:uncharacterized protein TNCV_3898871 [Trichonephila clavipes]
MHTRGNRVMRSEVISTSYQRIFNDCGGRVPDISSDLNSIKHVKYVPRSSIAVRTPVSMTIDELRSALVQEGMRLPKDLIKTLFGLAIHQNDHQARRRFVEWAQKAIAVVPDFHKRILFNDEAHFWLNGYVNKQNCRIWSEANPKFNGDRYRAMITNFFIPELNNHDVQELWFQQDCATCHTARATIDLLKDTLGDHQISRFGPVNWLPRSCDLTPLDYFLWGYVKSLVYADKPQTLDHLKDNICRVIADIRPQMLE